MLDGSRESYTLDKRIIRKDRSRVWVRQTVSLVRGPSDGAGYSIHVVEDITRRKEARVILQRLSSEEIEVLRHLALGRTNRQIATSTNASFGTVKRRVREILEKLEVSDRTQAAARAAEMGLLPAPGREKGASGPGYNPM
jgi:DNA-binding NarL/FixJ family response regulator